MDGQRTVQDLWTAVIDKIGEDAPNQDEVIHLLAQLHAADLLETDASPDALELFERAKKRSARTLKANIRNPLALRIPVWDPDRFLARTSRWIAPLAGIGGVTLWIAVVLPAIVLALAHWSELANSAPERILALDNLVLLWVVFPIVKLAHELGHAYATKLQGGEVHELGLMLLVLSPIPYVDSSAANRMRSKWRRAFVGLAGVTVEIFLAALALYVWLAVEPGLVRNAAFDVMVVAGVSTVLFNLNPLLRYDGYYVLADLIEIPNLAVRSARHWTYLAHRFLLGDRGAEPVATSAGEQRWLLFFAPASFTYRLFVLFGIALFVATAYPFIGIVLGLWALALGIVVPIAKGTYHLASHRRLATCRVRAIAVSLAIVLAITLLAVWVPLPLRTTAEGVVWLPENGQVRMAGDAFVVRFLVAPETRVARGTALVEGRDPRVEAEARVLEARLMELDVRLAQALFTDRAQADLLREERATVATALGRARERVEALVARAEADGIFIVPQPADLPGRFVRRGEVIGYVTDGRHRIIRALVGQDDIDLVRGRTRRTEVRIAGRVLTAIPVSVAREVPAGIEELPSRVLSTEGGGAIPVDPHEPKRMKGLERRFQLDLELSDDDAHGLLGARAYVRFDHGAEPLLPQLVRRARQLFLSRFHV